MMLPQTLPSGAEVVVEFLDGKTNALRTLKASIADSEWPMGKTVTYQLAITPEYELDFTSEPTLQDAHYVIYPIKIRAKDVPGESWTMTSSSPEVTLRTELTTLTNRGFWIEEDKGESTITSTATGDDITVYAFLTENVSDTQRDVTLELRPTSMPDAKPATFTISQFCPTWNGNIGCERIEDGDYQEELIFGLKRWLKKGIDYLGNRERDEFFKDEKSFDASLYTILITSEIISKINKEEELKTKYKDINLDELEKMYQNIEENDNFDMNYIYHLLSEVFPSLLMLIEYLSK